jgi:hypothetical protein
MFECLNVRSSSCDRITVRWIDYGYIVVMVGYWYDYLVCNRLEREIERLRHLLSIDGIIKTPDKVLFLLRVRNTGKLAIRNLKKKIRWSYGFRAGVAQGGEVGDGILECSEVYTFSLFHDEDVVEKSEDLGMTKRGGEKCCV